jgi:hypothetical protein
MDLSGVLGCVGGGVAVVAGLVAAAHLATWWAARRQRGR